MAIMQTRAGCGCKGCFLTFIIVIILVIALMGVGVAVVLNLTPNKLGFGDVEIISGQTFSQLGLGDTKMKEVYKLAQTIVRQDESKILNNKFDPVADKTSSENNLANTEFPRKADGSINYLAMLNTPVVYDNNYLKSYKDTNFAYIFNTMISDAAAGAVGSEDLSFFKELNGNIQQISIIAADVGHELKIVFSLDISPIRALILENIGGYMPQFMQNLIPNKIYFTSINTITADDKGELQTTAKGITINDYQNGALTNAIFLALSTTIQKPDNGEQTVIAQDEVNNMVGRAFVKVTAHLGKIGSAETDANQCIVGVPTYGITGITAGKITVITLTSADIAAP